MKGYPKIYLSPFCTFLPDERRWRKRVGVEPTERVRRVPTDLKSVQATGSRSSSACMFISFLGQLSTFRLGELPPERCDGLARNGPISLRFSRPEPALRAQTRVDPQC